MMKNEIFTYDDYVVQMGAVVNANDDKDSTGTAKKYYQIFRDGFEKL